MKILITGLVLSFCSFAFFPDVEVKNISGKYLDGKGAAYAQEAVYDLDVVKIAHKDIGINFNVVSKNLVLNDKNTSVKLKYDFSFLNVFKALTFEELDINSSSKKFNATSPLLNIFIDKDRYEISEVDITSDLEGLSVSTDGDIDIFSGILLNGDISFKTIEMASVTMNDIYDQVSIEFPEFKTESFDLMKNIKIPLVVRNTRLVVREATFSGTAFLDSWINSWLKIGGKINNNKALNQVEIILTRAKLGIFSVKKFLLKQVRKLNINGVTVVGNKITVDLNSRTK